MYLDTSMLAKTSSPNLAFVTADGILIRPAVVLPIERYTPERKAEFLLSNATTRADYRKARREVQKLGIDPDSIRHRRLT